MKQIALFIIIISFPSCSILIKKWGGIKDPQMETYQSINEYSKSLAIDSSLIVFGKDSASFFEINKIFIGCPEILIFNNSKMHIPYKSDSISCNASVDFTLENICKINSTNINNKRQISYDSLTSCFVDPNHCMDGFNLEEVDYVVFINYAKFTDGINKTHIIPWNKIIKNNTNNCKVKYIYVNLDYLNTWGIKKSSLPKLKIKAT